MLAMNVVSVWDSEALKILDDHFPSQCRLQESRIKKQKATRKEIKSKKNLPRRNFFQAGSKMICKESLQEGQDALLSPLGFRICAASSKALCPPKRTSMSPTASLKSLSTYD